MTAVELELSTIERAQQDRVDLEDLIEALVRSLLPQLDVLAELLYAVLDVLEVVGTRRLVVGDDLPQSCADSWLRPQGIQQGLHSHK